MDKYYQRTDSLEYFYSLALKYSLGLHISLNRPLYFDRTIHDLRNE